MKPSQNQVHTLYQSLQSWHNPSELKILGNEAKRLANYLNTLNGFKIINVTLSNQDKHVGRVIVDGVLQVASDYEKQVRKVVDYVSEVSGAATVSGFISFVKQHKQQRDQRFRVKNRDDDLLAVAEFFKKRGIETFDELHKWLEPEANRNSLLTKNSGLRGKIFKIGDKTADYFRGGVHHWDAVAVDRGIKGLLKAAGVSSRYNYRELRSIVQLAAVSYLDCRPIDLDGSIYDYYVRNKGGSNKPPRRTIAPASTQGSFKYCIHCGVKIPQIAAYCHTCGQPQRS